MNSVTTSNPKVHSAVGTSVRAGGPEANLRAREETNDVQRVCFLERDPVPPPLRGREARLERETYRTAIVWVDGNRRRVPKDWLVEGSTASAAAAPDGVQRSTSRQPDAEEDEPVTEKAWNSLQEAFRRLGLGLWETQRVIAWATGIPLANLDPSRLTWRHYQQAMKWLEAAQSRPATPPPLPPVLQARREQTAKVIYPPPSRYLGVAAYKELVAIAANLGLDEDAMVAQLGIPADCPGYLLDRPWVFAAVRGLSAIAAGQQPGQPDFSRAVLKFEYDSGSRLVVVGPDGTLLHGEAAVVEDMAQQLKIRSSI